MVVQISDIPVEVFLEYILPYVHPIQLWCCRRVCKTWFIWITTYFQNVQDLDFNDEYSEYYLTSEGLHQIVQSLCYLREIQLDMCHRSVTQENLLSLVMTCPRLEILSASLCREVTDDVLKAISEYCLGIKELHLNRCFQVSDIGLASIGRSCHKLEELEVSKCYGVTDKGLTVIFQKCPRLKALNIGWCYKVSDQSLQFILSHCNFFKSIRIKGCSQVSDRLIYSLCNAEISVNNFF